MKNRKYEYKQEMPKPIEKYSSLKIYLFVLVHPKTWKYVFRFIRTVIKDFWLQFQRKMGLIKTPIIYVDSPLDEFVPFRAEK